MYYSWSELAGGHEAIQIHGEQQQGVGALGTRWVGLHRRNLMANLFGMRGETAPNELQL